MRQRGRHRHWRLIRQFAVPRGGDAVGDAGAEHHAANQQDGAGAEHEGDERAFGHAGEIAGSGGSSSYKAIRYVHERSMGDGAALAGRNLPTRYTCASANGLRDGNEQHAWRD